MRINIRRVPVAFAVLAGLVVAVSCYVTHPKDDAYVGMTREQIIDQLGQPKNRWPGHYGLPPANWAKQFDPCETLTYEKWNGTLYLSVYPKNGRWVCFCSQWLPKGGVF